MLVCLLAALAGAAFAQSLEAGDLPLIDAALPRLPPPPPLEHSRISAPEEGEGAGCDLQIRPPQPKHGCYWEVLRDPSSNCLGGYRPVCMHIIPNNCGTIPERPVYQDGCAWISLHDAAGCIVKFICEPNDCPLVENDAVPGSACNWLPARDNRGCIDEFKCEPAGEPAGAVSAQSVDAPILPFVPAFAPRLPVQVAPVAIAIPPLPIELKRRPIAVPAVLPLPAPVPALPHFPVQVQLRSSPRRVPLQALAHFPSRPLCPAPPFKPANTDKCNWAPVFASLGCIVDWSCTEVKAPAPEPCPKAPRRPQNAKNCLWTTVTDDRGCVLKYECEPVKKPKCPAKPDEPEDTAECAFLAIRNINKCIIKYECIPRNIPLPSLLPPRPTILRRPLPPQAIFRALPPRPLFRAQPSPLLRPLLPIPVPRPIFRPASAPFVPPTPALGIHSPGFGPLGRLATVASRRLPASPLLAARPLFPPVRLAPRRRLAPPPFPVPRVTIPVAKAIHPPQPRPQVAGPIPKINIPVPVPKPELVPRGQPLPSKFGLGGFPGFQGYEEFQKHYQNFYGQQAKALEAKLLQGSAAAQPNLAFPGWAPQSAGSLIETAQSGPDAQPSADFAAAPFLPGISGAPGSPGVAQDSLPAPANPLPSLEELQSPPTFFEQSPPDFGSVFPKIPILSNPFPFKTTLDAFAVDRHQLCCWWAQIGECDNNLFYMRSTCQRSCGTGGCSVDSAESCGVSVSVGGCPWSPANPPPLSSPLPHTAEFGSDGGDCADAQPGDLCAFWHKLGYCDAQQPLDYIVDKCRRTCGAC